MIVVNMNTLHGADERVLDTAQLSLTAEEAEKRFQTWLSEHGFASKEDYYRECDELNNSEW